VARWTTIQEGPSPNMKFSEVFQIVQSASAEAVPHQGASGVRLCPFPIPTFLNGPLQQQLPYRKVTLATGLFGDLLGTVRGASTVDDNVAAIVLEWPDLAPRGVTDAAQPAAEVVADHGRISTYSTAKLAAMRQGD